MTDENGNPYLKYYDNEYKKWVIIRCNPNDDTGTEYIKNTLKKLFLRKYNI